MTRNEVRYQRARVEAALAYLKRSLKLDYEFVLDEGESEDIRLVDIEESNRGAADPRTFIVRFFPEYLEDESAASIRRHLFHEICHAMTWDLYREAHAIVEHVPDKALRAEFEKRLDDSFERIVYEMERKLGRRCFPNLPWQEP